MPKTHLSVCVSTREQLRILLFWKLLQKQRVPTMACHYD